MPSIDQCEPGSASLKPCELLCLSTLLAKQQQTSSVVALLVMPA